MGDVRAATSLWNGPAHMGIAIAEDYHLMRIHEIELAADYQTKVETERELIRA